MAEIKDIYKEKLDSIEDYVKKLSAKQRVQHIAWIVIGIAILVLGGVIFFRGKVRDNPAFDAEVQKYKDSIQYYRQDAERWLSEAQTYRDQRDQERNSRLKMEGKLISNQEKHIIINQKKNEIDSAVSALTYDSLRREFLKGQ